MMTRQSLTMFCRYLVLISLEIYGLFRTYKNIWCTISPFQHVVVIRPFSLCNRFKLVFIYFQANNLIPITSFPQSKVIGDYAIIYTDYAFFLCSLLTSNRRPLLMNPLAGIAMVQYVQNRKYILSATHTKTAL